MNSHTGSDFKANENNSMNFQNSNNREGLSPQERDELMPQIQDLKQYLKILKMQNLLVPNLFDSSQGGLRKIIEFISSLLKRVEEQCRGRMKVTNEIQMLTRDFNNKVQYYQKAIDEERKKHEMARRDLQKQNAMQQNNRALLKKNETQRQEMDRLVKHYQGRERTFEHQLKEKENNINKQKEIIQKFQGKTNYKNSFEIFQTFEPVEMAKKTEEEKMTIDRSNYEGLRHQNTKLKKSLVSLYRQIGGVLLLHQEKLQKIKNSKGKLEWLNIQAPESMNFYDDIKIERFIEDVVKYRQLLTHGQFVSYSGDQKEVPSVGVEQMSRLYKQVFEGQKALVDGSFLLFDEINPVKEAAKESQNDRSNDSKVQSNIISLEYLTNYLDETKKLHEKRVTTLLKIKEGKKKKEMQRNEGLMENSNQ